MKKLFVLLGLLLLTGCVDEKPIEKPVEKPVEVPAVEVDKTPLEILMEVYEIAGVDMLTSLGIYNKDDELTRVQNMINNGEEIEDFEAAVMNTPMMSTDARLVFIIQLSTDETVSDIEEKLEALQSYFVCVIVQEYQIVSNGNYVMFAGLPEHQEIVDAFMSLELTKEENAELENSSALSVLNQVYLNADITLMPTLSVYGSKEEVSYMIDGENNVVIENFNSAALNKPSGYDDPRVVFIIELSSNENIDVIGAGLHWMANYYSFLDITIEDYQIINNGNYVMFAGTDATQELVDAFIELEL